MVGIRVSGERTEKPGTTGQYFRPARNAAARKRLRDIAIERLYREGWRLSDLEHAFGVSESTVLRAIDSVAEARRIARARDAS